MDDLLGIEGRTDTRQEMEKAPCGGTVCLSQWRGNGGSGTGERSSTSLLSHL